MPDHVLVYRRDLFKTTENFVVQQAEAHRCAVTYVGEALHGTPPTSGTRWMTGRFPSKLARRRGDAPVDIVHAHFGVDIWPAGAIARHLDVPLAVTLHGFDVTRSRTSCVVSGRPNLVTYGFSRPFLLRRPELCLAVSSYIASRAVACGADPRHVQVHHLGAPTGIGGPQRDTRSRAGRFRIAHVARLVEKKGTRYLLDAVWQLGAKGFAIELVIVGDGPLRASLHQMVAAFGLGGVVSFRGELDHRAAVEVIGESDLLALPSVPARNGDNEGLGMVMLEAAALGVPVVATACGGIVDFLTDDVTGFLARPRDSVGLAAAIERCITDAGKAAEIAGRARAKLRAEFDVGVQTEKLEELFDATVDEYRAHRRTGAPRRV